MPSLRELLDPASLLSGLTGGESAVDAANKARELSDAGRLVALEHAPGDDASRALAELTLAMSLIAADGLAPVVEVIALPESMTGSFDDLVALSRDTRIALTIGLGADSDLSSNLELRDRLGVGVGITLPASWRGTERLCTQINGRVRVIKGTHAYGLPAAERFSHHLEVDKAFVRAARALIPRAVAEVEPSFATQDGRLVEIAETLAARARLPKGRVEFAMNLGRGGGLQERLVAAGESVRVTVPFGPGRLERLAAGVLERPGGIAGAMRSFLIPSS